MPSERFHVRVEERIDHGQPVAHQIGQGHCNQLAFRLVAYALTGNTFPVFDQPGVDVGVFHHDRIVERRHIRHAAALVTIIQIASKQCELFAGWLR